MAGHPIPGRARCHPDLEPCSPRRSDQLHHTRQHSLGEDQLGPALDPLLEHLRIEGPAQALLEMAPRVESRVGGADGLDPALERELFAVRLVDLEPGPVDGLFGVKDQTVEVEHERSDQQGLTRMPKI